MLEPTSKTPRRTGSQRMRGESNGLRNRNRRVVDCGRYGRERDPAGAGQPPRVADLSRSRRPVARDPGRPHLAAVDVDLHLRTRLPRHQRRAPRRRLLHARRVLRRQGRREARQGGSQAAHAGPLGAPRHPQAGDHRRARRRAGAQDRRGRRRLRLLQPHPGRHLRLRAAPPRDPQRRHFMATKPEVCWQVPVRREWEDLGEGQGRTTITEFAAQLLGRGRRRPVVVVLVVGECARGRHASRSSRPTRSELRELIGDAAYDVLREHCDGAERRAARSRCCRSPRPERPARLLVRRPAPRRPLTPARGRLGVQVARVDDLSDPHRARSAAGSRSGCSARRSRRR